MKEYGLKLAIASFIHKLYEQLRTPGVSPDHQLSYFTRRTGKTLTESMLKIKHLSTEPVNGQIELVRGLKTSR